MRLIATTLCVFLAAMAAVFGTQLAAVTALMSWRSSSFDLDRDALATLLVSVPVSSLALIAIALVAAGSPRRIRLRLLPGRTSARGLAAMIVGVLALSQALESLAVLSGVGAGPALDWMTGALATASARGVVLAVIVIGVLAPVGEELFFRGYMLTRLRGVWSGGPAVLVTALAFGLIHGELVHGVLATGIGLYLGALVERAGSVVPAVICHAANNTVSVILSATVGSPHSLRAHAVLLGVSAVFFVAALLWMRRAEPPAIA